MVFFTDEKGHTGHITFTTDEQKIGKAFVTIYVAENVNLVRCFFRFGLGISVCAEFFVIISEFPVSFDLDLRELIKDKAILI